MDRASKLTKDQEEKPANMMVTEEKKAAEKAAKILS